MTLLESIARGIGESRCRIEGDVLTFATPAKTVIVRQEQVKRSRRFCWVVTSDGFRDVAYTTDAVRFSVSNAMLQ